MPVDPNAILDAIFHGLSKIPATLLAAVILGGPTAIWLILRFTNPPDDGLRFDSEVVGEKILWVCAPCRSLNEEAHDHCYHCHRRRAPSLGPMILPAERPDPFDVGIPVGPGLLTPAPTAASWLGLDRPGIAPVPVDTTWPEEALEPAAANAADDFDETAELGETTRVDAVPVPYRAPVVEPRMTVSSRPPAREPIALPEPPSTTRRSGDAGPNRARRGPQP